MPPESHCQRHILGEKKVGTGGSWYPPPGQFGLLTYLVVTGNHREIAPETVGAKPVGLM